MNQFSVFKCCSLSSQGGAPYFYCLNASVAPELELWPELVISASGYILLISAFFKGSLCLEDV